MGKGCSRHPKASREPRSTPVLDFLRVETRVDIIPDITLDNLLD